MSGSQQLLLGTGAGGAVAANYIEDVFSTWLYTGTNAAQTITNGIDLAGKGGLVWTKSRDDILYHVLSDSATGPNNVLRTNSGSAAFTYTSVGWSVPVFNTNGYTTSDSGYVTQNVDGFNKFVSWTFRKQPKFFDVVTYTGNNTNNRQISHNLGSVPGCIIVKCVSSNGAWWVYHRSIGFSDSVFLNSTSGLSGTGIISATSSTTFTIPSATDGINDFGATYVAYLFAHNAGGFGLTGTDNVITCGSYTGTGAAGNPITLGYEPQYLLVKPSSMSGSWWALDNMRSGGLQPNSANAESTTVGFPTLTIQPTATGFDFVGSTLNDSGQTFIYIAIRRGPMKTPTTGTSVFYPEQPFGQATITGGFVADTMWARRSTSNSDNTAIANRLTGQTYMASSQNYAEGSDSTISFASNTATIWGNFAGGVRYNWARAPGFYDVVCYTGTNSSRAQAHNLSVAPEWIIAVSRNPGSNWQVFYSFGVSTFSRINLNTNAAASTGISYGTQLTGAPTASNINLGASFPNSIEPIVMYLFASLPGVSKVGSYTGTGAAQTINCGFTGGARFIMIKRTDSTGDWYVYDSARGISSGNDSYFLMNSVAAFDTSTNYVDTTSVGFQVTAAAPAGLNANGGSYIFLAIA